MEVGIGIVKPRLATQTESYTFIISDPCVFANYHKCLNEIKTLGAKLQKCGQDIHEVYIQYMQSSME